MPETNGNQNPDESYSNKYVKHVVCSYGYKLVCFNDKFSKLFKSYLGEDAVYNFVNSMTEESSYCTDMIKKRFNKNLVITKDDDEDFNNSTKSWICDNAFIQGDNKSKKSLPYHWRS